MSLPVSAAAQAGLAGDRQTAGRVHDAQRYGMEAGLGDGLLVGHAVRDLLVGQQQCTSGLTGVCGIL